MRQRGRRSATSFEVVRLPPVERLPPPASLSTEEAAEWTAVVNRMPADWFSRENHALLANYCRHVVEAERLAGMLTTLDAALGWEVDQGRSRVELVCDSAKTRERLLRMRDREVRGASSLATRLRLTLQSRHDRTKAVTYRSDPPPWEAPPPKMR